MRGGSSSFVRVMVYLLVLAFVLPTPVMTAAANENPHNAHVLRRLNSAERQAAIAEAARIEAEARAEFERSAAAAPTIPPARASREDAVAQRPAPASRENAAVAAADSPRPQPPQAPQSVTEVLFNYAAGFAGVPGLTPQRGVDGSLDEGLGFHQDGTARKAGGVTGTSGPSARGYRASAYMQSGLNAYGQGYPGLYAEMYNDLWGRDDPTRGGRVSSSSGYSRDFGGFNFQDALIDKGLNWGSGFLNSMGEAGISSLVDGGRARLNFQFDKDGYFSGEGDALLPWYDGKYTTVYTQLGARSMHDSEDTRWIGNFGLGQRWFPGATGEDIKSADYDAGSWMLGYNVFFDYDFTRDHQRGGIGAEAQWDWFRLSSNYYFPLSGWKGSEDFDSRFVKERPAEGWDARVKAYLPFYRNVAITGAYSQWYGDNVGMFGSDDLEKDPRVWSYGIEYTPVPLVSGFITQKSTERGRTDTEFGLNFTYHFQMPWEDQVSHSKVAELRTVGGSRHEFVDRENRIILEYKAKDAYRIEYLGRTGVNAFKFRLVDGFGKTASGQSANVSLANALFAGALASSSFTSNGSGEFTIQLDTVSATPVTATIKAGGNTQSFTLADATVTGLSISPASLPNATEGVFYSQTLTASGGTGPYSFALAPSSNPLPAWLSLTGDTISGTPTATSASSFTIRVTDNNNGQTAEQAYSLTVGAPPYSLSAFTVSESYSSGTVTKTITVTLSGGSGVSGKTINWSATVGMLSGSSSATDGIGVATLTLTHSILESSSVTATVNDDTSVYTTETVYFGPSNAPKLDMSTLKTSGYYYANSNGSPDAVSYCGSESNIPSVAEMAVLSNTQTGWWNSSGVGVGLYRTRGGVAPYHDVVDMPDGLVFPSNSHDYFRWGVVCLAP
ncbi:MAG: hypothetical protein DELT_02940 [Desulfovibrio sp.]